MKSCRAKLSSPSNCPTTMNAFRFDSASTLTRRSFLRASGIAIALPLLDIMRPRLLAAAGPAALRRRMVCINTSLGIHTPFLYPEKAGRDYVLTPYLEPLAALREDFTVCSGLSHPDV